MTQGSHSCSSASFWNPAEPDPCLCLLSLPAPHFFHTPYGLLLGGPSQQIPHTRIPVSSLVSRGPNLRKLPRKPTSTAVRNRDFVLFFFQRHKTLHMSLNTLWVLVFCPVCLFRSWRLVTSIVLCTSFRSIHIKDEEPKENFGPLRYVGGTAFRGFS